METNNSSIFKLSAFLFSLCLLICVNTQAAVTSVVSSDVLTCYSDIAVAGAGDTITLSCDDNGYAKVNGSDPLTGQVLCSSLNGLAVYGGAGDDIIDIKKFNGANGTRTVDGGAGNDEITGSNKADTLSGGADNDTISGRNGSDTLSGDAGDDQLNGGNGRDALSGGTENDTLNGNNGRDTLLGDAGDDTLSGNNGRDNLDGGEGTDTLTDRSGKNNTCVNGEAVSCR